MNFAVIISSQVFNIQFGDVLLFYENLINHVPFIEKTL